MVNKDYLLTVARFFAATPDAMAAGGAIYPVYETEEPEWMSVYTKALITAYKDEGSKIVRLRGSKFPSGGNAAYRREVFDRVGLFDTELGRKGTSLISGEEKAVFDKMKKLDMPIYYLPDMILYHIIPPSKLTKEYFDNLTLSIGKSEKLRTLSVSRTAYAQRIVEEIVKWVASILLCLGFYSGVGYCRHYSKLMAFSSSSSRVISSLFIVEMSSLPLSVRTKYIWRLSCLPRVLLTNPFSSVLLITFDVLEAVSPSAAAISPDDSCSVASRLHNNIPSFRQMPYRFCNLAS